MPRKSSDFWRLSNEESLHGAMHHGRWATPRALGNALSRVVLDLGPGRIAQGLLLSPGGRRL
eukprot:11165245-Lingulodinium_polyedra.AAC.1